MSVQTSPAAIAAPSASAAPESRAIWRRVIVDSLWVSGASLAGQSLGVLTSLALRMLLSPAQMGIWQGLKLLLSYGNYSNFGISKAAARSWSRALGSGDTAAARRDLNVAFTASLLTSALYGLLLAVAAAGIALRGGAWNLAWAGGLAAIGLLSIVQRWTTFQVTMLRAQQQFAATSRLALLEAIVTLLAAAGATWLFGLPGLYLATLLVLLASLIWLRRCGGPRLTFAWQPRRMLQLAAVGGPLLLAGAAWSLLRSIDKLMILACLDDREFQLGCYSTALLVGGQLFGLANMLSTVMVPRYGHCYGASGCVAEVAHMAARSSELLAAVLSLAGVIAITAGQPLLSAMLPDYQPGLAALVFVTPGAIVLGLTLPVSQMLVAVGRERQVLVSLVGSSLVSVVATWLALRSGGGLAALAAATSLGYLVHLLWLAALGVWPHLGAAERLRYTAITLLAISSPLLAVACGRLLAIETGDWRGAALRTAIATLFWLLPVLLIWSGGDRPWQPRSTA